MMIFTYCIQNSKYKEAINSIGRTSLDSQLLRKIQIMEEENKELKKVIQNNKRVRNESLPL